MKTSLRVSFREAEPSCYADTVDGWRFDAQAPDLRKYMEKLKDKLLLLFFGWFFAIFLSTQ
ncbi:MAG: hypothetical protein LBF67_00830 [Prevotellaceae bacterium]|nr:hypothetical protein [Prevotellaceae bacterium]